MVELDEAFLEKAGLSGLPADVQQRLLQHVYTTLEMRVGMRLADQMTDTQMDEFEELIDADDEEAAHQWLQDNFPHYPSVVREQCDVIQQELLADSARIRATVQPGDGAAEAPATAPPLDSASVTIRSVKKRVRGSEMSGRKPLRVAAVQLDYIPRMSTHDGYWLPIEPLVLTDPLGTVPQAAAVRMLLQDGVLYQPVTELLHAQEVSHTEAFCEKLRQILQYVKGFNIDILVLPEASCPLGALDLLREYSQQFAIFAGLGRVTQEDAKLLPVPKREQERLTQRNVAVFVEDGRTAFVAKKHIAAGEHAVSGDGVQIFEFRRHDREYRLGVAICLDYLNERSHLGGMNLDFMLVASLSPETAEFIEEAPRNYVRVFANHARYGGSTIVAPGIGGPAFAERSKAHPLPPGVEGISVVDFEGYGTRPSPTYAPTNRVVLRAEMLYPFTEGEESDAFSIAEELSRLELGELRPSRPALATVRGWVDRLRELRVAPVLRAGLEGLLPQAAVGTLTPEDLTLFASHLRFTDVPTVTELRYQQLTEVRDLLRAWWDKPGVFDDIGACTDAYRRALDRLAPLTRRKYRHEEHQYVPVVGRRSDEQAETASSVFFAARLGPYETQEAVAALPRQLAVLQSVAKMSDPRLRLVYRVSTVRGDNADLRPVFDVVGFLDDAGPDEVVMLREGMGQQLGRAFSGAWQVSGTAAGPTARTAWQRELVCTEERPLIIREDWAPLVDYLRALQSPVSIELRCSWVDEPPIGDRPLPTGLRVSEGFADPTEQKAAAYLERAASFQSPVTGSLRLVVRIGAEEPLPASTLDSIGVTLLGHAAFEVRDPAETGEHSPGIGRFGPELALRLFHPPYGRMEGRGLDHRRSTSILVSGHSFPSDGVRLGTARTASGREDQAVDVRISDIARRRHVYVLGRSGSGKTNLLKLMARQDIAAQKGVAVIDPHGDMVDYLLGHLSGREAETVLLDFGHPEYMPVLNPLDLDVTNPEERRLAIEEFISMLVQQSYHQFYGPRFEDVVRLTLESIIHPSYPESTPSVLDLVRLLRSPARRRWLQRLLAGTEYEERWRVFEAQRDTEIGEVLHWVLSKFSEMSEDGVLGQVLSGGTSSVSIEKCVREGGILLVRLPEWEMSSSAASMLGMLVQQRIRRAAYSRWRTHRGPRDIETFHLYVDEFQNFATTGFEELVAEARKFGLGLTVANQNLSQLSKFSRFTGTVSTGVVDAILANVATLAVLGVSSKDERVIADEVGISTEAVRALPPWTALMRTPAAGNGPMITFTAEVPDVSKDEGSLQSARDVQEAMVSGGVWRRRADLADELARRERDLGRRVRREEPRQSRLVDDFLSSLRTDPAADGGETAGEEPSSAPEGPQDNPADAGDDTSPDTAPGGGGTGPEGEVPEEYGAEGDGAE